uniref:Uncharacterized protein n=1 Tax=Caenorhabditis japonica TaxID=281687 RepID=A0A8R1DTH0_CAEJA
MNLFFNNNNNNNINHNIKKGFKLSTIRIRNTLKRKFSCSAADEVPPIKVLELEYTIPSPSKPTIEIMGVEAPMRPDYNRLPDGCNLGNLAEEKFAGIIAADLYDVYEIQIYCRLFEHFSYYPIYNFDEDVWIPAHVHAYNEVINFRTPPSVIARKARAAR